MGKFICPNCRHKEGTTLCACYYITGQKRYRDGTYKYYSLHVNGEEEPVDEKSNRQRKAKFDMPTSTDHHMADVQNSCVIA